MSQSPSRNLDFWHDGPSDASAYNRIQRYARLLCFIYRRPKPWSWCEARGGGAGPYELVRGPAMRAAVVERCRPSRAAIVTMDTFAAKRSLISHRSRTSKPRQSVVSASGPFIRRCIATVRSVTEIHRNRAGLRAVLRMHAQLGPMRSERCLPPRHSQTAGSDPGLRTPRPRHFMPKRSGASWI